MCGLVPDRIDRYFVFYRVVLPGVYHVCFSAAGVCVHVRFRPTASSQILFVVFVAVNASGPPNKTRHVLLLRLTTQQVLAHHVIRTHACMFCRHFRMGLLCGVGRDSLPLFLHVSSTQRAGGGRGMMSRFMTIMMTRVTYSIKK